jgi:hypothetical protein
VEVSNNKILSSTDEATVTSEQNNFWNALQQLCAAMAANEAQMADNLQKQQQARKEFYRQQQAHRLSLTTALSTRQLPPLARAGIEAPVSAPVPKPYFSFEPGHPSFAQVPFAYTWNSDEASAIFETGKFHFQPLPEWRLHIEKKVEGLPMEGWQWKEPENWPMLKADILNETETLRRQIVEEKRLMATVEARQRKAQARLIDTAQLHLHQLLAKDLYQAGLYNQEALLAALASLEKQAAAVQLSELNLNNETDGLAAPRPKALRNEPKVVLTEKPVGTGNKQAKAPREKSQQFSYTFSTTPQVQLPPKVITLAGEELAALMNLNGVTNNQGAFTIKITTAEDVARAMEEVNRLGKTTEKLLREMEQKANEDANEAMQRLNRNAKRYEQEIRIERGQSNRGAIVVQIAP